MNELTGDRIDPFISDCEAQCVLYEEMLGLARRQDALIGADNLDGLLELVAVKQALMRKIAVLDERGASFRAVWRSSRSGLTPEAVARVEKAVGRVEDVLRRLVEQEKSSTALAGEAQARRASALRQGATAKRAFGAYLGRSSPDDPRFVDQTQ